MTSRHADQHSITGPKTNSNGFLRHLLLGVSASALTLFMAGTAGAATDAPATPVAATPDEALDEIVVSGYRRSLEDAIALKRDASQIVEAVSAEDIGKLPDNSIAESLARLPGLTAQRVDGRDQVISIRGMGPDFSTTLLNGREQVSTGNNRAVEFDQYPSELLDGVVVYKTPQAGIVSQGLAGTVDMRTVRPLEYGKTVYAISARGEVATSGALNSGTSNLGYRVNGTYVDQNDLKTLGWMIGVSRIDSPTEIKQWQSWGYPSAASGSSAVALGGAKALVNSDDLQRTGVTATLEYQPVSNFTSTLDGYYSKFREDQIIRGVEMPLLWGGLNLQPGYTTAGGVVTNGQFDGVKAVVRNNENLRDADLYSLGWNNTYTAGSWTIVSDISHSEISRKDDVLEMYAGTGRVGSGATDNVGFNTSGSGLPSLANTLNYADPGVIKLTSPQGWGSNIIPGGQDGYLNIPTVKDQLSALRLSVEKEFSGGIKSIEIGSNFTTRQKSLTANEYFLGLKANAADPTSMTNVAVPSNLLLAPTSLGMFGLGNTLSFNPLGMAYSGLYNLTRNPDADTVTKSWVVSEDALTNYVKANIDTPLSSSVTLTGNIGVQIVSTYQSSSGTGALGGATGGSSNAALSLQQVKAGADYTNVLPSVNLAFNLPDSNVIRVGMAREMARARMDQMAASINYGYNATYAGSGDLSHSPWSGSGGNPKLRPWMADAVDVSYENYFAPDAYFALAGYIKRLENYIYQANLPYNFAGFNYTGGTAPLLNQGLVSIPENGQGGRIKGFEVTLSLPGHLFTPLLDGFGVISSFSYTESSIDPFHTGGGQPLPGLSRDVYDVTVYYEKSGFSARTSLRHRSSYLSEVAGFGDGRTYNYAAGETLLDAQVGYDFQDGTLRGLSIMLQGSNLTNEPFITYQNGDKRQVLDYEEYGPRVMFGVSYKY